MSLTNLAFAKIFCLLQVTTMSRHIHKKRFGRLKNFAIFLFLDCGESCPYSICSFWLFPFFWSGTLGILSFFMHVFSNHLCESFHKPNPTQDGTRMLCAVLISWFFSELVVSIVALVNWWTHRAKWGLRNPWEELSSHRKV